MDVRFAFRSFTKNPGFTAVVLLTLALGIGGSTSIFSVVNGVLLRPLPYPDPDRLVSVQSGGQGSGDPAHAPADYLDLQREQRSFSAIAAHRGDVIDITAGVSPEQAADDVEAIAGRIEAAHARSQGRTYALVPLREELVGAFRQGLLLLLAAVGCVLLIACANVAGLLVARGVGRQREVGIRSALGAKPNDVLRLVVGEGMKLVAAGTVVGVIAAVAAGRVVAALLFGVEATDPATYAAVIAVLALVAFAACYLPALRAARVNPMSALRSE